MGKLPDRGDLVWVAPQTGHERAVHRPALVVSPLLYHRRSKLAVVCPITSNVDPWPWKVVLPAGLPISGAVLADQVRSIDRAGRKLKIAGQAPEEIIEEVQARLAALLGITS